MCPSHHLNLEIYVFLYSVFQKDDVASGVDLSSKETIANSMRCLAAVAKRIVATMPSDEGSCNTVSNCGFAG